MTDIACQTVCLSFYLWIPAVISVYGIVSGSNRLAFSNTYAVASVQLLGTAASALQPPSRGVNQASHARLTPYVSPLIFHCLAAFVTIGWFLTVIPPVALAHSHLAKMVDIYHNLSDAIASGRALTDPVFVGAQKLALQHESEST